MNAVTEVSRLCDVAKRFCSVTGDTDCSDEGFEWGVVVFAFSSGVLFQRIRTKFDLRE